MAPSMRKGQRCKLLVTIQSASNLRAADINFFGPGTSDPYVKCKIRGKPFPPNLSFETKVLPKTLNPIWTDEDHLMEPIVPGDAIEFEIYDRDRFGAHDLLGKATLEFHQFYPNGFFDSLVLMEAGSKQQGKATLKVNVECEGMTSAGDLDPRCFIQILRATNLKAADWGLAKKSTSDPYVVCQIVGKERTEIKTKVIMETLEPEWNEEFEMIDYEIGDDISFQVMDWDNRGADDPLGDYTISYADYWKDGAEYHTELELNNTGMEAVSLLEVKVTTEVPELPKVVVHDPAYHVVRGMTWPVPFQLRSLDTGRTHRLAGYTRIGRSAKQLDASIDLILNGPGTKDISKLHATIKCWQPPDSQEWHLRLYKRGKHGTVKINFSVLTSDEVTWIECGQLRYDLMKDAISQLTGFDPSLVTVNFNDNPTVAGRLLDHATSLVQAEVDIPPEDNTWNLTEDLGIKLSDMSELQLVDILGTACAYVGTKLLQMGMRPFTIVQASGILCDIDTMVGPNWVCGSCGTENDDRHAFCAFSTCQRAGEGFGAGPGGGHAGGGTSVGNVQVDGICGIEIHSGDTIRFGINESWLLDKVSLFPRSNMAMAAVKIISGKAAEDPTEIRNLRIPNIASHHALQGCMTWFDLSRVVLEWLGEPDEPPCVDAIEVLDEVGALMSRHEAATLEE